MKRLVVFLATILSRAWDRYFQRVATRALNVSRNTEMGWAVDGMSRDFVVYPLRGPNPRIGETIQFDDPIWRRCWRPWLLMSPGSLRQSRRKDLLDTGHIASASAN